MSNFCPCSISVLLAWKEPVLLLLLPHTASCIIWLKEVFFSSDTAFFCWEPVTILTGWFGLPFDQTGNILYDLWLELWFFFIFYFYFFYTFILSLFLGWIYPALLKSALLWEYGISFFYLLGEIVRSVYKPNNVVDGVGHVCVIRYNSRVVPSTTFYRLFLPFYILSCPLSSWNMPVNQTVCMCVCIELHIPKGSKLQL